MERDDEIRVCLVSGGTKGLGRAFVEDLLGAGMSVATFARSRTPFVDEAQARHGERFFFDVVDAADPTQPVRFAAEVARRFGRLDALVNNAGILVQGLLTLTSAADVHRMITVNLEAALVLAQACAKVMLRQHRGRIVNVSSVAGLRGDRGVAVYSATKAGLDGFTRSLARELGARNILVNCVAPGHVETDLTAGMTDEHRQKVIRRTPLGRLGTVEDILGVVRFLLSPAARFITGQTIVVDGGLTC
jgi:3-oxoacyl-[acyl-carrier protein] reductase